MKSTYCKLRYFPIQLARVYSGGPCWQRCFSASSHRLNHKKRTVVDVQQCRPRDRPPRPTRPPNLSFCCKGILLHCMILSSKEDTFDSQRALQKTMFDTSLGSVDEWSLHQFSCLPISSCKYYRPLRAETRIFRSLEQIRCLSLVNNSIWSQS